MTKEQQQKRKFKGNRCDFFRLIIQVINDHEQKELEGLGDHTMTLTKKTEHVQF